MICGRLPHDEQSICRPLLQWTRPGTQAENTNSTCINRELLFVALVYVFCFNTQSALSEIKLASDSVSDNMV